MFGLDYVIFRPHNVYGERQNIGDRYRNVIGIFMNQILHRQPLSVFGDGTQVRAFTHINDIAPTIASCVDLPAARNQIFNVGTDTPYTINDMAETVAEAMGTTANLIHLEPRNEVKIAFADHSKAHEFLARLPRQNFRMASAPWRHGLNRTAPGKAMSSRTSKSGKICLRVGPWRPGGPSLPEFRKRAQPLLLLLSNHCSPHNIGKGMWLIGRMT